MDEIVEPDRLSVKNKKTLEWLLVDGSPGRFGVNERTLTNWERNELSRREVHSTLNPCGPQSDLGFWGSHAPRTFCSNPRRLTKSVEAKSLDLLCVSMTVTKWASAM